MMKTMMLLAVVLLGLVSLTTPVWALEIGVGGGVESAAQPITYSSTMHPFTWTDVAVLGSLGLVHALVTPQNYGLGIGTVVTGLLTWGAWRTHHYGGSHPAAAPLVRDGTVATSLALAND